MALYSTENRTSEFNFPKQWAVNLVAETNTEKWYPINQDTEQWRFIKSHVSLGFVHLFSEFQA